MSAPWGGRGRGVAARAGDPGDEDVGGVVDKGVAGGLAGRFEDGESTVLLGGDVAGGQVGLAAADHDDFAPLGAGVSDDRHAVATFRFGGGFAPVGTGPRWGVLCPSRAVGSPYACDWLLVLSGSSTVPVDGRRG